MPPVFLRIVRGIDAFTTWIGKAVAWLAIPLVLGLVYEVIARKFFNEPTDWAYDLTYMQYGTLFMLGAAYTLYKGSHIRTDIFYRSFSPRWQGIVDAALYLFFFFPGMVFFLLAGYDYALRSWQSGELAAYSPWRPPIYPFKTVIPVTAVLLLIQGVSELIKSVYAAIYNQWPAEHQAGGEIV